MRNILHIDMNAFFASVEQRSNPALRGRPMAVVGSERRGVVLSPSYEARAFGVKTGMMYHEARALCPEIVLVPASSGKYSHACEGLVEIWRSFTPLVELFSIDEAFLDVTGCEALFGDPVRIAVRIKERTWEETGLTCSVGIGPNKLLAKLGSDMQKPDGLVLITPDDIPAVMEDLPVKEICGIGPNLTRHLAALGVRTCGELSHAPLRKLTQRFGIVGERLRNMGRGIDDDPVVPLEEQEAEEAKSMGHSMTLAEDCSDRMELERHILHLSEKVGRRLRRGGYQGSTVSLVLRSSDFHTFSRRRRLRHPVNHGLDIHAAAAAIFRDVEIDKPVRLVGVSVSDLDRHATLEDYAAAKARIYRHCRTAVINRGDALVRRMVGASQKQVSFGLDAPQGANYGLIEHAGEHWLACGGERLLKVSELRIRGTHNIANALAALALGAAAGLPRAALLAAVREFAGLPHRMQYVGSYRGVEYYDDSKGTNLGATLAAVAGVSRPLVLIAGGDGKHQDFAPLAPALVGKARAVVLLGKDAAVIETALAGRVPTLRVTDMDAAVTQAAQRALPGDWVLLSPACSSLDMFDNFEHRGRVFAAAVGRLGHG